MPYLASGFGTPPASVGWILPYDIILSPCRTQMKHALSPEDMRRMVAMCDAIVRKMNSGPGWVDTVWFTDESHVSDRVN